MVAIGIRTSRVPAVENGAVLGMISPWGLAARELERCQVLLEKLHEFVLG